MSKYDNYGGASYDPAFDGGDVVDWNPVEFIGDIEEAVWSSCYGDPTGWSESTVEALVFEVEVPEHDAEGCATDGSPYQIPDEYVGKTTVLVAGCYWDWGHSCDGFYEACPADWSLEQAQMGAHNLCDGPLDAAEGLLTDEEPWLPGNPEMWFFDEDTENPVVVLKYWRPNGVEPYESETIGFDPNEGPARAIWEYCDRMDWIENPPNKRVIKY